MRSIFSALIIGIACLQPVCSQQLEFTAELITETEEGGTDLFVSGQGIYVLHRDLNRLTKFSNAGERLWVIGGKGSGNYQFDRPADLNGTNGMKVYVSDLNNNRVIVYDRRGQFLSTIESPDTFGQRQRYRPDQVYVNPFGEVFFADLNVNEMRHFDLDGNTLPGFPLPSEIKEVTRIVGSGSELLIHDIRSEGVHVLSESGLYQNFIPFPSAEHMVYDGKNEAVVRGLKLELNIPGYGEGSLSVPKGCAVRDMQWFDRSLYLLCRDAIYRVRPDS